MPSGVPSLGANVEAEARMKAELAEAGIEGTEVVGNIRFGQPKAATWTSPDWQKTISIEEGPAPWEVAGSQDPSDARVFITCPDEWVLYWVNPRVLDALGWRGWKPVLSSDPRVKVKVPSMVSVENNIRRGGQGGDLLCYMPRHWYEVRKKQFAAETAKRTQASLDKMESLKDDFKRGKYGPNVSLDSAKHPTHTMADPQEMRSRGD
jgi:hypothetical protein